jgi:DNA-binding transcriptional ArsR family regulator
MRNSKTDLLRLLKAVASPLRLKILEYLEDPVGNFPPQVDGDPLRDGICADFIRDKLGIAAATASRHLTLLSDSGLLIATRKKGWTFYRRDEDALARFGRNINSQLVRKRN